jgi:hypothetical protein
MSLKIKSNGINYNVPTVNDFPTDYLEEGLVCVVTDENQGGTFVYREDNALVNNGGTIFDGWTRQYDGAVNVKWFGAVAGQDASMAINSALASSDNVLISEEYVYSQPITARSGVTLSGTPDSLLTLDASSNIAFIDISGLSDVTFSGLNIKHTETTVDTSAVDVIYGHTVSNIKVIGCTFIRTRGRTVGFTQADGVNVSDNVFKECGNSIRLRAARNSLCTNNIIDGTFIAMGSLKVGIAILFDDDAIGDDRFTADLIVSKNVITNLGYSQAILAHGGKRLNVCDNLSNKCSVGIGFNIITGDNDFIDCTINNNIVTGFGVSDVGYVVPDDVGITLYASSSIAKGCSITNNTVTGFNFTSANINLGGISVIGAEELVIANNILRNNNKNGIVFSGFNSSDVQVFGNSIVNTVAGNGIKISSTCTVAGIFRDNLITTTDGSAYRIEAANPSLVVREGVSHSNTTINSGDFRVSFNGVFASANSSTPSVANNVNVLIVSDTSANSITSLSGGKKGQIVTIKVTSTNTTIVNKMFGSDFYLDGTTSFTMGLRDTLTVMFDGSLWYEIGRSKYNI